MGTIISSLKQTVLDSTPKVEDLGGIPDIAVLSSGTKPRHTYFSRAFKNHSEVARITYTWRSSSSKEDTDAMGNPPSENLAHQLLAQIQNTSDQARPVRVLVDVSCLPRPAIAQVFASLKLIAEKRDVELVITYSLATYAPSPAVWAIPNISICPVHPAFSGWTAEGPGAPLDIVVGLGYERGKAVGAVEYLEPRNRWVFVPESPETAYLDEVRRHNKILMDNRKERIAHYNVLDPLDCYFSLRSLTEGVARSARPVLLPFGPKIFFAVSLLVAMAIEEAAIWHVSGENDDYGERSPSRHSVILNCLISHGAD